MRISDGEHQPAPKVSKRVLTIGCVSYLNAKPLIDEIDWQTDANVKYNVPSRLLESLESGQSDIALCPVIDYHRSRLPLEIVPAGGIGCLGPTLTVRLYSQVPFASVTKIHTDCDSHTSVALLRIVLSKRFRTTAQFIAYKAPRHDHVSLPPPQAILLIGDKVVTDHPDDQRYPYQMDLGEAWHELTGLPFVFAVWMTRQGHDLGTLPDTLDDLRIANACRLDDIADRYGPPHGWPVELARQYLNRHIRYQIHAPQLQAIEQFSAMAFDLGLIRHLKTLRMRP